MKKIYLALITLFIYSASQGQTVILSENFTNYDSTSGSHYNGWELTYFGAGSYYTSVQSSGVSGPNSYKFGKDSTTVLTPFFSGGDSVHFHIKGNTGTGGTMAQSTLTVYESPDGATWNLLHSFNPPMTLTASMEHFALAPGTVQLKFYYDKDTGNVAFDDFSVTSSTVGINTLSLDQRVKIYPTPTSGKLTVNFGTVTAGAQFSILNIIGKEVLSTSLNNATDLHTLNLSSLEDGIYFVQVKADRQTLTKRIIVKH